MDGSLLLSKVQKRDGNDLGEHITVNRTDDQIWDIYYREMSSVASAMLTSAAALWINLQFVHHFEKFSNVCAACSWPRFYGQLETCKLQTLLGDSNIEKTK